MITFNKADLRQRLPAAAFSQGSVYWLQHRVSRLSLVQQPDGSQLLSSEVKGSGHQRYYPKIILRQDQYGQLDFDASCTCPVGYLCKHVAATLLAALESGPQLEQQTQHVVDEAETESTALEAVETLDPVLYNWLQALRHEAEALNKKAAENSRQRVLYLLKLVQHEEQSLLCVNVVTARRLKSGGYGSWYPLKQRTKEANYLLAIDKMLLKSLKAHHQQQDEHQFYLQGLDAVNLLERLLLTERCHWETPGQTALRLSDPRLAHAEWNLELDGRQRLYYELDEHSADYILPLSPPWYVDLDQGCCGSLDTGLPSSIAGLLATAPTLEPEQVEQVRQSLKQDIDLPVPQPRQIEKVHSRRLEPVPHLRLYTADLLIETYRYGSHSQERLNLPLARLSFYYGELKAQAYSDTNTALNYFDSELNALVQVPRCVEIEQAAIDYLLGLEFRPLQQHPAYRDIQVKQNQLQQNDLFLNLEEAVNPQFAIEQALLNFSLYEVPKLREQGWRVEMDGNYLFQVIDPALLEDWYVEVEESNGIDWFGLELGISLQGERINLLPLLVDMLNNFSTGEELAELQKLPDEALLTPRLPDGRILPLPLGRVRDIIMVLIELLDQEPLDKDGRLRMLALRAAQLIELEQAMKAVQLRWFGGERIMALGRRLQNFTGIKEIPLPDNFKTELRPYQHEGLNWLQFLREYQLSGVLADDMGLGKTVQTLAHILVEKNSGRAKTPTLVIAPTSLMMNWRMESQRFTPDLKVLTLHGPSRQEHFDKISDYDLVLTTYPLLHRDKEALLEQTYHLLILDEAQHIKNPKAKATQIVHQLHANHRLCLTGTPMENHLGELWSLFHFLLPGLLGDLTSFRRLFRNPIEKDGDPHRREILARRISPFLLRRTKEAVVTELPEKNEIIRSVELEGSQRDLYETIRLAMHDKVRREIASKGIARSQLIILDALLKLRQVCCDPRLLKLDVAKKVKTSAKLDLLMDLVPEMVQEGRRILLFSQFTSMLSLIERALKKHNLEYTKLTGQTRDREQVINRFQQGEVPIFLISLKAGGTGLNLTTADTVIHYDPWWNPAVENQATDRAHRIGQEKKVFVYKLLTAGTVEEKIQVLQARKKQLADALFGEQRDASLFSQADLDALFEPL